MPLSKLDGLNIYFLALTLGQGGAERQLYYLIQSLVENGANVRLLSLTKGEYWQKPIEKLGVSIIWVGQEKSRLLRLTRIFMELRKNKPDIFQSQHFATNLYVAAAGTLLQLTTIGAVRSDIPAELRKVGNVPGYFCLRSPQLLVVNSKAACLEAAELGVSAERLCHLPNVVDTSHFFPTKEHSRENRLRLLAVGRLVEAKRFDLLLEAVARLKGELNIPFKMYIVGDGPLRGQLRDKACKLRLLHDTVEFVGAVTNVAKYYQESDILVSTSDWEGTPNVVLEAMASGLPVVATDVGDIANIIQHGTTGFVTKKRDVKEIVGSVLTLVKEPKLRGKMGQSAREYVAMNYSLTRLPHLLLNLYDFALSKNGGMHVEKDENLNGHERVANY